VLGSGSAEVGRLSAAAGSGSADLRSLSAAVGSVSAVENSSPRTSEAFPRRSGAFPRAADAVPSSAETVSSAADGVPGAAEGIKQPAERELSSAGVCARAAEPFPQGVGAFLARRGGQRRSWMTGWSTWALSGMAFGSRGDRRKPRGLGQSATRHAGGCVAAFRPLGRAFAPREGALMLVWGMYAVRWYERIV
jgi:hypothetical protein